MEYAIGILIGIVLIFVVDKISDKLSILSSTKDIFGIIIWLFLSWFMLVTGSFWFTLFFFAMTILYFVSYFKDKRKEQTILNTVQYMINQEKYTTISIADIEEKLNNKYSVIDTLNIYKSKAIIPYNIEIVE